MSEQESENPDRFWHARAAIEESGSGTQEGFSFDLELSAVQKNIVQPWREERQFSIGGLLIKDFERVSRIQIVHTPSTKAEIKQEYEDYMHSKGWAGFSYNANTIPFEFNNPSDFTNEFLFEGAGSAPPVPDVGLIISVCERFPYSYAAIRDRRAGNSPYEIENEYDVHDLLLAILRAYIEGVVEEDPLTKVAGVRHGRLDIGIPSLGALIEIKYAREVADQKRIIEQFSQDLVLYPKWNPLRTLIFFVHNSSVLRDPEAIAELEGEQEVLGVRFMVKVVLV